MGCNPARKETVVVRTLGAAVLLMLYTPLPALADAAEQQAQLCLLCHKTGNRFTPLLEQQPRESLAIALTAYKTGRRSQTSMTINAAGLSASDIEALSGYFATRPFPARRQELDPAKVDEGQKLLSGSGCEACHGPAFRGGAATPALAGQTYLYLVGQMSAFRRGGREHPTPMFKDEADSERAASYLASLR